MTDWPDLAGRLTEDGHVLPVRVYYEDTDFTGVVYHGAYVKFFERGRSDFLRLCGIHHKDLQDGIHGQELAFAVRRMTMDFRRPARVDDVLEVQTVLREQKGARVELRQTVLRNEQVLVCADVTVAVITLDGRPARLPAQLAAQLKTGG